MPDHCEHCRCPEICLRWPIFCEWAKSGDAIQKRHICARSAMRPDLIPRNRLAETYARLRAAEACPFRSRQPGCCAGARCALKIDPLGPPDRPRRGGSVSHQDCMACVERYG